MFLCGVWNFKINVSDITQYCPIAYVTVVLVVMVCACVCVHV